MNEYMVEQVTEIAADNWWPKGHWIVCDPSGFGGWGRVVACCATEEDAQLVAAALQQFDG